MSSNMLGKINKQLSEENTRLQSINERLKKENEELRIMLSEHGDGKVIPKMDSAKLIISLRLKIKSLEEKLGITNNYNETPSIQDRIKSYQNKTNVKKINIRKRIKSEDAFDIIREFLLNKGIVNINQIMDGTALTESQARNAIKKFSHLFDIKKDENNKRVLLYEYVG